MKTKIIQVVPVLCFSLVMAYILDVATVKTTLFVLDPVNQGKLGQLASVNVVRAGNYDYTDIVPKPVVIAEIKKQAGEFKLNEKFMLDLAQCESSCTNHKKNPISTAKGVFQWVAASWDATASGKARISPYDYKANIRETMIKIANNELSHWSECIKKIK